LGQGLELGLGIELGLNPRIIDLRLFGVSLQRKRLGFAMSIDVILLNLEVFGLRFPETVDICQLFKSFDTICIHIKFNVFVYFLFNFVSVRFYFDLLLNTENKTTLHYNYVEKN